jgi:hypothetical protein
LALRSDWAQFEKGFNEEGMINGNSGNSEGSGFRERFGRLSIMMKELEGLRLSDGMISMGIPSMPAIPTSITSSFTLTTRSFSG